MNKDIEPRSSPAETIPPVVISIDSKSDPNSPSVFNGLPATQRQIDYEIILNGQRFLFPNVWATQTVEIGDDGEERTEVYFQPEIGNAMTNAMFRYLHPKEAFVSDIIEGRVEDPQQASFSH